ncbi:MAG TPA: phosphatidylinositol-specific phospholipase C [Kofleriaceae bacterium]
MSRASLAIAILCAACGDDNKVAPDGAALDAALDTAPLPDAPVVAWMSQVDCATFSCMTIPGSHDSGATHDLLPDTSKAQDLTITEQLDAGVRYFDIRLKRVDDLLTVFHGGIDQDLTFQQVLDQMQAFQAAYPTEAILMSVKEETTPGHSVNSFETDFLAYVTAAPDRWVLGASVPSLADAAGKLVLVRRFDATTSPLGIDATNWADNATFDITDADAQMHIEDNYIVTDVAQKWTQITDALTAAEQDSGPTLHLTYTSGYVTLPNGLPSISMVSSVIDPQLATLVPGSAPPLGVVVMDHVTPSLVQTVYSCNRFILTRPE